MRRLTRYKLASLLLCGLAAAPSQALAQAGRAKLQTEAAPQQEARPETQPLRVKAVSPELDAVLRDWNRQTAGIKKLQGEHRRWKYDTTFAVAKVASGKFFYEGPDKGRIDIEPVPPKSADATIKDDAGNVYSLKPDQAERWICDGKRIVKIDDPAKTYEVLPIPPEHQGANIMDGPLPFLFGLPPEKAKQRYDMTLVPQSDPKAAATTVFLIIRPLQQKDAANWQRADVMLDKTTYLPKAVKLIDPAGTGMTVFSFGTPDVNPVNIFQIFTGDPFRPTLFGYKQIQSEAPAAVQPLNLQGKPIAGMPSVMGLKHTDAKSVLGQRGFRNISVQPGPVTDKAELRLCVAQQTPAPGTDVKPGEKVELLLYVTQEDLKKYAEKP